MPHEKSITVEVDGKHYVIRQPDGKILLGPFDTKADAEYRAKIRSDMYGDMTQGMPEGAGPLGLGELGATMEEGYQPRSYGTFDPEPTEWGPVEKDPFGDYREMEYGTDSAQMPKGSRAVAEHQSPKEDFKGFLQDLYNTPLSSWTKRPEDKEALGALGKKLFTPDLHPAIDRYRTQRYGQER